MNSLEKSVGYVFGNGIQQFDPSTRPIRLDVIRRYIYLFDQATLDVRGTKLIPQIKSQIIKEIVQEVLGVWNGLNLSLIHI